MSDATVRDPQHSHAALTMLPRGLHLDSTVRAELAIRWNNLRMAASGTGIAVGVVIGLLGFDHAWYAVLFALVVGLHAYVSRRRPVPGVVLTFDIVVSFIALELLGVSDLALGIVYVTYGVLTVLLCTAATRAVVGTVASVTFFASVYVGWGPTETAGAWEQVASWIAVAIFLTVLMAVMSMTIELLNRQITEIAESNDRLDALVHSKDELIATVSHEIRTPLTAVLGFSAELRDAWDSFTPATGRSLAESIVTSSRQIAYMAENLAVASRADLGTLTVKKEPVDLESELQAFLADFVEVEVSVDIRGAAPRATADPLRLRQILRNLVVNATAHGGEQVWLEVAAGPDGVLVRVCDDGPGLPDELVDVAFAPFERVTDRVTRPEPLGLGLATARLLARAMEGDLVYRRIGGVTIFELSLPAAPDSQAQRSDTVQEEDVPARLSENRRRASSMLGGQT